MRVYPPSLGLHNRRNTVGDGNDRRKRSLREIPRSPSGTETQHIFFVICRATAGSSSRTKLILFGNGHGRTRRAMVATARAVQRKQATDRWHGMQIDQARGSLTAASNVARRNSRSVHLQCIDVPMYQRIHPMGSTQTENPCSQRRGSA